MSNKSPLLNIIFQSLNKVTRNLVRDFGEIENLQVSPNSIERFVSKTQNQINIVLTDELSKARPEWEFKSNPKSQSAMNKHYWIVDILSGKLNFSHGVPYFAISISVELDNEIISTVVLDPLRDEI